MEPDRREPIMAAEPSVLDWLKSLFTGKPIPIPDQEAAAPRKPLPIPGPEKEIERRPLRARASQLRLPVALLMALIAQRQLEVRVEPTWVAIAFYLIAAALVTWAFLAGDFPFYVPMDEREKAVDLSFRPRYFVAAVILSLLTVLTSSQNHFRLSTVIFWWGAVISLIMSLWEGNPSLSAALRKAWQKIRVPEITIQVNRWTVAFMAVFALSIFFRFYRLNQVPYEMWSDQAEKLLDVVDVLNGKYSIFFPRNTGREAFQFYLAAATAKLFNTGITFLTLKIGTALAGVLALPFIYLFGKELYGRRTGLLAMALAGVAYWPNAISRVGLRFPLYPLFAAPALYFLVRGLKRKTINDFLICGVFIGLGLHGYSPTRLLPVVIAFGVLIYLFHRGARGNRYRLIAYLFAAGLVALIIFLPLLRAGLEMRDVFLYRSLSRLATAERELPGPPLVILFQNIWNAVRMFGWDNGEIWVISIPARPALDWITGAVFHLGVVLVLVRYIRRRNWQDIFVLLSVLLLMLPSILSLAFPSENPAPNRASGAIIPVFTLAAIPLAVLFEWVRKQWPGSSLARRMVQVFVAMLLLTISYLNYDLIFNQFADQHLRGTWNTSTAGRLIRGFADSIGSNDNAHVVPYQHWMDTRLVGMLAGTPTRDYALWPEDFGALKATTEPRLFLLNPQDEGALNLLKAIFPDGEVRLHRSNLEGKDIVIFFVPHDARMNRIPLPEAD